MAHRRLVRLIQTKQPNADRTGAFLGTLLQSYIGALPVMVGAALDGGTEGDQFDPCAYLACDTSANLSLAGLDQMADAAAHGILDYATSTAGLRRSAVEDLVTDVETLGVPHGIENGLLAKLESALRSIDEGRDEAAIHQLEAFINQVEAKRGTQFTDAEADALIAMTQAILDDLR